MKLTLRFSIASLLLASVFTGKVSYAQLPSPAPAHIVVLWEENYAYTQIIGSSYAPNINAFVGDPHAAVFTQFFAIEHPSQPNYIDFFSGANQGLVTDDFPTTDGLTIPFTTPNLAAELLAAGKTFKTFSEDLPSVGSDVATYTSGGANYARKHNPCTNWVGTAANQFSDTLNQPFTNFPVAANYSSLPTVSFVVPNMTNDMHDGSYPSNITVGDTWMNSHLSSLKTWALDNNTLYIIIYDEDDDLHGNNIPVVFYGGMVKGGTYTENVNFYYLLRTIEDMYSLTHAGSAATATPITDCWQPITGLGVNNTVNKNLSFTIVPNPASDIVTFNCNIPLTSQATITVTDITGRIAGKYTMTGTSLQVNTSAYVQGIYSYAISDRSGKINDGKFVIAHN